MVTAVRLSERIDTVNDEFTERVKGWLLQRLPDLPTEVLDWLVKEHYQFSSTNVELLGLARDATAGLTDQGARIELERNIGEESGHAVMYRKAMGEVGTDVDEHTEFEPTTVFFDKIRRLSTENPSCSLGTFYATETAAIFEHQVFDEISREICQRRGLSYQGSRIKKFHDIHLDEGVEQGHKDGLAAFVDVAVPDAGAGDLDSAEVERGAYAAIEAMVVWWDALLAEVVRRSAEPAAR
ncbi:MAG: DUF3865 domain-containing protein [Actinobacteria bacterium]|nr:DUF3865 domain-containing protein [Actinomycetota bacterium]